MATAVELPPPRSGAYLTDGHRLLLVVDSAEDHVALEDCGEPCGASPVFWLPVAEVLGWRRVLPA